MNSAHVQRLIRALLVELGEDPERPGLVGTPERVARVLSGFRLEQALPPVEWDGGAPEAPGQMLLLRGLEFVSLCEHHLLPFFGRCQIGCLPRERAPDPAWCLEVMTFFARRPQLQERITEQLADALFAELEPEGLGVAIDGRHLCMMMRGVEKQRSHIQTSSLRGSFLEDPDKRSWFDAQLSWPATASSAGRSG